MYFIHENVEKIENKNPDAHARRYIVYRHLLHILILRHTL